MFRSGVLALQESFDVAGEHLALYSRVLAFGEFFGRRNSVSAGVLGDVHARIGYADNVFGREAVHGKTGHPEAAGDVVLGEHGIGGHPWAKALGKALGRASAGSGTS